MNTLYEVLEVSENASAEVIEKAYKVLVKKYHPDLQSPENRLASEKKMKEINEAYDILGDEAKEDSTMKNYLLKGRWKSNNKTNKVNEDKSNRHNIKICKVME